MTQLYTITDDQFQTWLDDPDTTMDDMIDAIFVLKGKQESLFQEGHTDSYHRDRYERHERYNRRIVKCAIAIAHLAKDQ